MHGKITLKLFKLIVEKLHIGHDFINELDEQLLLRKTVSLFVFSFFFALLISFGTFTFAFAFAGKEILKRRNLLAYAVEYLGYFFCD